MRMLHATELPTLLAAQPGPCVSLYLDTRKSGRDPQALRATWNGLLDEADALVRRNYAGHRARFLLEPMRKAPEILSHPPHGTHAMALFRSFTTAAYYPITERAPERVTVADTFHLKPLLKSLQAQETYFALALSQKRISLYRGNREGVSLMATYDADYGEHRVEGGTSKRNERIEVPRGKAARNVVTHFRPSGRVTRFLELSEPYLWNLLHRESSPLILVGTPFMHRLYRNMNCYPYLSANGVLASLPHDAGIIHRRTWPLAERIFLRHEVALCERYFEERQKGKASHALADIARASIEGRVSSLLVSKGAHLFGALDRDNGKVELRDPAAGGIGDDVLDDIAQQVILRKGQALVLPGTAMPTPSPVAAVYRW